MRNYYLVIALLTAVTLGLILFVVYRDGTLPHSQSGLEAQRTENRIAPNGAAAPAAKTGAVSQAAYGGTLDGSLIYNNLCASCHTSGAGGAPKLDAAGLGARADKGKDLLYKHSIEGFTGDAGVMPAKGGNPALTDEQIKVTVDWMLDQV